MPDFGEYAEVNTQGAPVGTYTSEDPTATPTGGNIAGSVLSLQKWLAANGFNPGPLDGVMGPRTAGARDAAIAAGAIDQAGNVIGTAGQQAYEERTGDSGTPYSIFNVQEPAGAGGDTAAPTGGGGSPAAPTGGGTATSSTTGTSGGGVSTAPTATAPDAPIPRLRLLDSSLGRTFYQAGDKWYVTYAMESGRSLIFEASEQEMTNLYGTWRPPATATTLSALTSKAGATFAGSISEMVFTGDAPRWFEDEVERVTTLALDEGILPSWAKGSQGALDILYTAQSEGKSNDWVLQQLSSLPSFKERFPGLKSIQDLLGGDLATSIDAWLEFEQGTKQALAAYGMSDQVVNPALVGELLAGGHSLTTIQTTIATFDRMEKFAPAFEAFNSILEAQGMSTLDSLDDMFKFASGMAPSEMYDVYEASSIAEAMDVAGLGDIFSAEDAIAIGLETDQTLESASKAAQKAAEMLLRMRHEVAVGDFGLDHEELIDISFGRAARSGRSEAEIMDNINRAVTTAQANINTKRADPYKSYSAAGTIQAASLGNLRQQS